jgi:hypothetical protein
VPTGRRHAGRCTAQDPPSAGPSSGCTDDDQAQPTRPPLKPPLDKHRSHHDAYHQIASTVRHTTTLHLTPCDTTVSRLPLDYKRRRRPPSRGGETRPFSHPHPHTILEFAPNQFAETILPSAPSPASLVGPPLRAPRCLAIQRHERTPAGHTAHGRNQDKPRFSLLLSTGHRETDLSTSTS